MSIFQGVLANSPAAAGEQTLHRIDCGHGQRSLKSEHAELIEHSIARIVLRCAQEGADPQLKGCGHCKPEIKGLLP